MDKDDLEYFRELLTKWRQDLPNPGDGLLDESTDLGKALPDPIDRAKYETERSMTLGLRSRATLLLRKINQSLQDIDDGVFGICDLCGEEIGIGRLKARPVTRYCIDCKTELEKQERLTES
jgi:DnaK suppressor protein